jgi:hypothetical protein
MKNRFVLGLGAILTAEGKMEFKTDKVKEVAEMIEKAHAEVEEGIFVPSRDMDELNYTYPKSILDAHVAMETDLGSMH